MMKEKCLPLIILLFSTLFTLNLNAQDCDLSCPDDDVIVSYSLENGYVVPDFFTLENIAVSENCNDGSFSQTPTEGTVLLEGEYEVNLQIDFQDESESCSFTLVVQDGGQGGGKCVVVCPDTLFIEPDNTGAFAIPDFFDNEQLFFGDCVFTTSTQAPEAGSMMANDTMNIFLTYTIEGVSEECNFVAIASNIMGVAEMTQIMLHMYPNPASTVLYIETEQSVQLTTIFDITGKKVHESDLRKIDISDLRKGLYVVQVKTQDGMASKRLVVK